MMQIKLRHDANSTLFFILPPPSRVEFGGLIAIVESGELRVVQSSQRNSGNLRIRSLGKLA